MGHPRILEAQPVVSEGDASGSHAALKGIGVIFDLNIYVRRTVVGGLLVAAGASFVIQSDVNDLRDDLDGSLTTVTALIQNSTGGVDLLWQAAVEQSGGVPTRDRSNRPPAAWTG